MAYPPQFPPTLCSALEQKILKSEVAEIRARLVTKRASFCSARGQSCLGIIKGCARPFGPPFRFMVGEAARAHAYGAFVAQLSRGLESFRLVLRRNVSIPGWLGNILLSIETCSLLDFVSCQCFM